MRYRVPNAYVEVSVPLGGKCSRPPNANGPLSCSNRRLLIVSVVLYQGATASLCCFAPKTDQGKGAEDGHPRLFLASPLCSQCSYSIAPYAKASLHMVSNVPVFVILR